MCGINGIMTSSGAPPDRDAIIAMQNSLVHRGPDGSGIYFNSNVGMAHRRLAIIDLETGNQPFSLTNGTTLIANAEIYNYIELKAELSDVDFKTTSDCEVPLHLYAKFGEKFADYLRGMYAIAIHDPITRRLVLSRDPFGIKPLYYAVGPFGFAFASEPQAFLSSGLISAKIRKTAAEELLQLQFSTGRETVLSKIFRVLPGETLIIEAGRVSRTFRREALPPGPPQDIDEGVALDRVGQALVDSVDVHQRSDVPYGMFLSGGIDSSAILAAMARLNDQPVHAFTVGFSDTRAVDEREHAAIVAKSLGAEHIEIDFTEEDFWHTVPLVARVMDDPVADYAELPTYKLGAIAGQQLKVILCGEGGDELFGGYSRYRSAIRPWWGHRRAMRSRGALEGMNILRANSRDWRNGIAANEKHISSEERSALQNVQANDFAEWLPHDLLLKLDRCLMAHGVEGRTPMLDPVIAKAVFRLPDSLKIKGRAGKWILRKWVSDFAPAARPFSKKRGFTVPVGEWILRKGAVLGPLVAKQTGIIELCNPHKVESIFKSKNNRAGFAAWVLLFYAVWHQLHVEGYSLDGDVFSILGDG